MDNKSVVTAPGAVPPPSDTALFAEDTPAHVKNRGCMIFSAIVAIPIAYVIVYIMFPSVRPTPPPNEVFIRLTNLPEMPRSVHDLKIHYLFNPLLGDGSATISFGVSEEDGQLLASQFTFRAAPEIPSTYRDRLAKIPVEIEDPRFAFVPGFYGERDGLVKTNRKRTVFLWVGTL